MSLLVKIFTFSLLILGTFQAALACPDIDSLTDRNCDSRLIVVAFGDSITYGRGDNLGLGYAGRLKLIHPRIEIVNLGAPGESTPNGEKRAARTLPYFPDADYTLVLEGVNDYFLKTKSYGTTKDNLLSITRTAKSVGPQTFLANLTDVKRNFQAPWVKGVNATIAPFRSLDFYSLGTQIISSDNLHPHSDGYQAMAQKASILLKTASLYNKPADSDKDGIYDFAEIKFGTNPNLADSDGDGLIDGDEVFIHKSNPTLKDSDGDGFDDHFEVTVLKSDPSNPNPSAPKLKSYKILKES